MQTRIYLRDTNDPLKDMGFITHEEVADSRLGDMKLPWYFEDTERVLGFDIPNATNDHESTTVFALKDTDWKDKIIGRTPVITSPNGMYQFPHIVVSKIEEVT